jgi:hypothetical protein
MAAAGRAETVGATVAWASFADPSAVLDADFVSLVSFISFVDITKLLYTKKKKIN